MGILAFLTNNLDELLMDLPLAALLDMCYSKTEHLHIMLDKLDSCGCQIFKQMVLYKYNGLLSHLI